MKLDSIKDSISFYAIKRNSMVKKLKERLKSLKDVGHYRTPRYAWFTAFERAGPRRTPKGPPTVRLNFGHKKYLKSLSTFILV